MKRLIIFIILCVYSTIGISQIYVDPTTAAAMATHSAVINGQLSKTNDNLTLIQRGQLAVTGQLTAVNSLQSQIYSGLSEVSAAVRSLIAIKEIVEISTDIVSDVNKALDVAKSDPVLLLFAEASARDFKTRATRLSAEVSSFVLQGGKSNLMDSGERAKLLNRIVTELMIIRGAAYGMHKSMFWAKQKGLLNALNPYSRYINIDERLADEVIRNAKYLKQ